MSRRLFPPRKPKKDKVVSINKNKQGQPPPKEPVDLSKLDDGAYPLDVYAILNKKGNEANVILIMPFQREDLSEHAIRFNFAKLQIGLIIMPGQAPSPRRIPPNGGLKH
jgi:hypothetical protein